MTSAAFNVWKQNALGSGTRVDLDGSAGDVFKIRLLNIATDYSSNDVTLTSMSTITKYSGTTDQTLSGLTIVTNSPTVAFDATDPTFTSVAVSAGKTIGGFVIYKFVTDDAGSTPILYVDGFTAVTPNGGDIAVTFDSGNNRIVSLV